MFVFLDGSGLDRMCCFKDCGVLWIIGQKWEHLRTMEARREICKQLHQMIIRWSDWKTPPKTKAQANHAKKTLGKVKCCFYIKGFSNCKCNVRHEMVSRQKNSIQLRFQGHGTSQLSKSWKMSSWLSQRIFWNETNIWSKCSFKNICQKVKWICVVTYGMVFCILAMLHKRTKDSLWLNLFKAFCSFTFNKKSLNNYYTIPFSKCAPSMNNYTRAKQNFKNNAASSWWCCLRATKGANVLQRTISDYSEMMMLMMMTMMTMMMMMIDEVDNDGDDDDDDYG